MKKAILILLAVLLLTGTAYAAPFLVCDTPDPTEQVILYIVYQDGVEIDRPVAEADGSLKMDLQAITPGVYDWTVKAVNVWGDSGFSNPYVSPSNAGSPQNTRMEP